MHGVGACQKVFILQVVGIHGRGQLINRRLRLKLQAVCLREMAL